MDDFGMSLTLPTEAQPDWQRAEEFVATVGAALTADDEERLTEVAEQVPAVEGLDDFEAMLDALRLAGEEELRRDLDKVKDLLDEALRGESSVGRFRRVGDMQLIDMLPNTNADGFIEYVWGTGLLALAGFRLA